jgi:hypothetical protein
MVIRARLLEHLLQLPIPNLEKRLRKTPKADYRWRVQVSYKEWHRLLSKLGREVRYPNFKDAAKEAGASPRFLSWLTATWNAGWEAQEGGVPSSRMPAWTPERVRATLNRTLDP